MTHELKRLYEGKNEMHKITPTCSCGWVGIDYAAWNDYQHTMVKDQESEHIRAAHRSTVNGTGDI